MKKLRALTLIEVLLVLAVMAVILLAGVSQIQRYQSNRNIAEAKAAVQVLSSYAVDLYLANCAPMQKGNTNYLCSPDASKSSSYCYGPPSVSNPFYKNSVNYVINILFYEDAAYTQRLSLPKMLIALPVASSFFPSANASALSKYLSMLQPTLIAVGSAVGPFRQSGYYTPDYQLYNGRFSGLSIKNDPCLKQTGQAMCFEWIITQGNWGNLATNTTNNQAQANEINSLVLQYSPSVEALNTNMKQGSDTFQCTELVAGHAVQNNN